MSRFSNGIAAVCARCSVGGVRRAPCVMTDSPQIRGQVQELDVPFVGRCAHVILDRPGSAAVVVRIG
jgi:hypothetical protein